MARGGCIWDAPYSKVSYTLWKTRQEYGLSNSTQAGGKKELLSMATWKAEDQKKQQLHLVSGETLAT